MIIAMLAGRAGLTYLRNEGGRPGTASARYGHLAASSVVSAAWLLLAGTTTFGISAPCAAAGVVGGGAAAAAIGGAASVSSEAADSAAADMRADISYKTLFMTWQKLDRTDQGVIAVPAVHPVDRLAFSSSFGIRNDPFRRTAAMHAGVDIPGPVGTPVYATADGIVGRAERAGGYGNLVEIEHGKGIQTRYGHLSKLLVAPFAHVHRGQLIALMGSTGRSTGPHLHYEVRIDGHAVNPMPFLQVADYAVAAAAKNVAVVPEEAAD